MALPNELNDRQHKTHVDDIYGDTATRVVKGLKLPVYDYTSLSQASTTDTWTFKIGGSSGTVVGTLLITYTDSTKETISTVALS